MSALAPTRSRRARVAFLVTLIAASHAWAQPIAPVVADAAVTPDASPAVTPDAHAPALAPNANDAGIAAPASDHPVPHAASAAESSGDLGRVARVVLGLMALLALAIAAGHRSVTEFERRYGIAMVAATGLPFLVLGLVARLPAVGILSDDILRDLRPLLEFGLGWIGFRVGSEFDVRDLDRLPRGAGRLLAAQSGTAFVAAGLGAIAALAMVGRGAQLDRVRDGVILGACAAVSAPSGARALEAAGVLDAIGSRLVRKIVQLDDAVPIAVLALVTARFRPVGGAWVLPTLAWVFLQVGMGAALGILTVAMDRAARNVNEEVALTFGAVAFASGMAGYVGFSPLAVGCVAGIVVSNLISGRESEEFQAKLRDLERPIYMAFFAVAGALWDFADWRGWAIVPLFVLARLFGKLAGARAAFLAERSEMAIVARRFGKEPPEVIAARVAESSWIPAAGLADARAYGVALIPMSVVAVAVIISAHQSYPDQVPLYLETVVIAGAVLSEIVFQFSVPSVREAARARGALVVQQPAVVAPVPAGPAPAAIEPPKEPPA